MKAQELYQRMEKDFISPALTDDWFANMQPLVGFLSENFKQRSMGLVCDNAQIIEKVYTAVFPSKKVMQTVLNKGTPDAMLFVHHPQIWDIRMAPEVFQQMDKGLLQKFVDKRISIYNLHSPLDNFSEYSTSVSLAKVLDTDIGKKFAPYNGGRAGIFGKITIPTTIELKEKLEKAIGHKASLYQYGEKEILNGSIAIVAGGANEVDVLKEIAQAGINVFVTGITTKSDYSKDAHEFAQAQRINILGGTHYSTEKFACIALCDYFKKAGLDAEFIHDDPILEDL